MLVIPAIIIPDEYGVLEKTLFVSSGGKKKDCALQ